jgi:hypothetical protein
MRWPDRVAVVVSLAAIAAGCARPLGERYLTASRGGWTRAGAIQRFTPENLYDYINGQAPFVISFGFRTLAQGTYRLGTGAEATVDLYDMVSADNAFALFRSQSDVEAPPLDIGTEGVGGNEGVEFWQGRFYVAVSVRSSGKGEGALAIARELSRDLPPTKAWPAYLQLLPQGHRIARSEQYAPADLFGYEFLKRAVHARYTLEGSEARLFACRYDSPEEAAKALARIRAALSKPQPAPPLALGEGSVVANDATLGAVAAFRCGRFVGGMSHYVEGAAAKALLADLERRLRGAQEASR